ncbi:winged helix-turn-helix domain-containing protein [Sphingomonas sp. 10B4]|uniref:winged helix-turn-helix domain-containing protein n=1 Tax=Sphingomonas sp. 10B4 TaxID=3048575 RepID=UPI002AB5B269|nr:winged helix-turn-helix domain-containing protein [Sphingomonas sp. 10B4]MDY7523630.1 winged helix-turn-helix domain-containing protein [Sphingomonas sp. 10B4]
MALFAWVSASLPRTTRTIGAWIADSFGLEYSHAGLIALLHRLNLAYRKGFVAKLTLGIPVGNRVG